MVFQTLLSKIVSSISGASVTGSGTYVPSTYMYDYALGGVPFLSAAGDERPDVESPAEQRKQQFDNTFDPGEQSLNQWWLRSQESFVGGAGVVYQDPDTQGQRRNIRYAYSLGIDPFTDPDSVSLIRQANASAAWSPDAGSGVAFAAAANDDGTERVWVAKGRAIQLMNVGASDVSSYSSVTGVGSASSTITGRVAPFNYLNTVGTVNRYPTTLVYMVTDVVAPAFAGIYRANSNPVLLTPIKMYDLPTTPSQASPTVGKAQGVPWYAQGNKLYQLSITAVASALPAVTAQIAEDQIITDIVDGPDSVYVAANDAFRGYIYKATLDSTTGLVNGLRIAAVLPDGERINSMAAYVATYLIISTTSSIRVGQFTGDSVTYDSPIIQSEVIGTVAGFSSTSGFGEIAFFGTRAYVAVTGESQHQDDAGIICVDLSSQFQDANTGATSNAYAPWTYVPGITGTIYTVTTTNEGRIIYTLGTGATAELYVEHETDLVESGYLDTGRCRFNTTEPKLFKYISLRTPPLEGNLSVAILTDTGGVVNYVTYNDTVEPGIGDISTPLPSGQQMWIALRFTLYRNSIDATKCAVLDAWQIKALPGTLKQRIMVRNFLCFNSEKDKSGQVIQGDTQSLDKLNQIRAMSQRGDTVIFQDLVNEISDQVIIDDYKFTMLTPPGPNKENYGGYLTVWLRTVADNVSPLVASSVDEE